MQVADAVKAIKRQFGDEYDVLIIDDDIYQWMYECELDIIRNAGSVDLTVTHAVNGFPQNYPDSVQIRRIAIEGKGLVPTSKETIDTLGVSDQAVGSPTHWYTYNKQVFLWPKDVNDTRLVSVTYRKTPTRFTGVGPHTFTVPEAYHADIITYCIGEAHNKNKDATSERIMKERYVQNTALRRDEAQSHDGLIYRGVDPLDFEDNILDY